MTSAGGVSVFGPTVGFGWRQAQSLQVLAFFAKREGRGEAFYIAARCGLKDNPTKSCGFVELSFDHIRDAVQFLLEHYRGRHRTHFEVVVRARSSTRARGSVEYERIRHNVRKRRERHVREVGG